MHLSPSNWIEIVSIIASLVTSVTAIVISVLTLKTTKESIDEANRPYVVAYLNWEWIDEHLREFLVIKNFGVTGATINSIDYSEPWINSHNQKPIFYDMNDYFIAPSQKYVSLAEVDATGKGHPRSRTNPITLTINYSWNGHSDSFKHTFTTDAWKQFEASRAESPYWGSEKSTERLIYRIAKEFSRRNM